jgi:proline iminopeptidase
MRPSEGYITTADGVRLFFQSWGSSAEICLIPNGLHLVGDFERLAAGRTLIAYDVRNRGRSDLVSDPAALARGIDQDVDDLESVRRHFGISRLNLIGHSYMGTMVVLYALKYPDRVNRVVQIGAVQPYAGREYPAHLSGADATRAEVLARLAHLQTEPRPEDPEEACRRFWSVLKPIYVTDPADVSRVRWERCDLPNERNFMKIWTGSILPSLQRLKLTADDVAPITAPVLIVHGARDRSAPYGGGRDWALILPNARLVTVDNGGHGPWIEAPDLVFASIRTFLDGEWPQAAERLIR